MASPEPHPPELASDTNKENHDPTPTTKTKSSKKIQPKKAVNTPKPPPKRAVFSADDNRTMVETLMEQKDEGHATDNGGWREPAINAVVNALKGSELKSGGAAKIAKSVRDHWGHVRMLAVIICIRSDVFQQLKVKYNDFKTLASISGWGWDSENNRVQASDEQWDTYLQVHLDFFIHGSIAHIALQANPKYAKYRNTTWDLYEDMDDLLNGALATGKAAFHPGQQTPPNDDSDSGNDSGRDSAIKADDDDDEGNVTEEEMRVSATPAHASLSSIKVWILICKL